MSTTECLVTNGTSVLHPSHQDSGAVFDEGWKTVRASQKGWSETTALDRDRTGQDRTPSLVFGLILFISGLCWVHTVAFGELQPWIKPFFWAWRWGLKPVFTHTRQVFFLPTRYIPRPSMYFWFLRESKVCVKRWFWTLVLWLPLPECWGKCVPPCCVPDICLTAKLKKLFVFSVYVASSVYPSGVPPKEWACNIIVQGAIRNRLSTAKLLFPDPQTWIFIIIWTDLGS